MNRKAVSEQSHIVYYLIEISFISTSSVSITNRVSKLDQKILRMNQAADILLVNLPLPLFGKDIFEVFKDNR